MAAYLVALALIVFWPTPVDKPAAGILHQMISWLHVHGMPKFIGYAQIEFFSNILLFVPMGVIAAVRMKNVWLGVGIGFLASCIIELSQALFLAARFPSALDVLANTLGAAVGAGICCFANHQLAAEFVEPTTETAVELVKKPNESAAELVETPNESAVELVETSKEY